MRTVSVRELKSNPSAALRDARDGPVLVVNRGLPEALLVSVADGQGSANLDRDVAEAIRVVRRLAERHGTRAVQAVDRATARRAAELRASYGSSGEVDISLATLAATLQAVAAPMRITRHRPVDPSDAETVIVVIDHEPARAELGRIEAAAAASGRKVIVRVAGADDADTADEEVLFDRSDVPVRAIDLLIAKGRARPAVRRLPFPVPVPASGGKSALEELLRERDGDPR
ncbi:MAG: type II toxin-antitoxin system Phd/YefM family antitoxin [Chloroflexi bacterium]|nr:type II toxin-antitoxin system Phd/YefM family antitoxin [Chloroflexota bacterium]